MPMVWIFKIWPTCGKVTTQATNFLWILRTYAANKEIAALCLFLFLRRLSKKAWHLVWKSKVFFFFNPRKLHAFFSLFLSDAIPLPIRQDKCRWRVGTSFGEGEGICQFHITFYALVFFISTFSLGLSNFHNVYFLFFFFFFFGVICLNLIDLEYRYASLKKMKEKKILHMQKFHY